MPMTPSLRIPVVNSSVKSCGPWKLVPAALQFRDQTRLACTVQRKTRGKAALKRPPDRGRYCGNTMNKDTRGAEEYLERLARSSDEVKMLKWRQSKKLRGSVAWRPHAKPQPTCHSGILAGHHCPKMQGSANPHRQTRTLDRPNKHTLKNHHQAFNM